MTLRPPAVAMRARKPWVRMRRVLWGWYVRFMSRSLKWAATVRDEDGPRKRARSAGLVNPRRAVSPKDRGIYGSWPPARSVRSYRKMGARDPVRLRVYAVAVSDQRSQRAENARPILDAYAACRRMEAVPSHVRRCGVCLAVLVCVALASSACEEPGGRFACDCAFLTDFDDSSTLRVEVCAANFDEAGATARGCAQSAAPARVESCRCHPTRERCRRGDCALKSRDAVAP